MLIVEIQIELTSPAASEQSRADCEAICKLGLKAKVKDIFTTNRQEAISHLESSAFISELTTRAWVCREEAAAGGGNGPVVTAGFNNGRFRCHRRGHHHGRKAVGSAGDWAEDLQDRVSSAQRSSLEAKKKV